MLKGELRYLTVLRAFAAIWVALHHCATGLKLENDSFIHSPFLMKGWLGVDLFFILSGFILSFSYQEKMKTLNYDFIKEFLIKRLARLYPAHLFTLALYFLIIFSAIQLGLFHDPYNRFNFTELSAQLLLMHGIGFFEPSAWNIPSWSISSEGLAYLFFPFIFFYLQRFSGILKNLALIVFIFSLCAGLAHYMNDGMKYMLEYKFTWIRVLSEFIIGMALFNVTKTFKSSSMYMLLAVFAAGCLVIQSYAANPFYDFMYLFYFMILIHSLALTPRKSKIPILSTMGETSYSFYLIHSLVLIAVNQVIQRVPLLSNDLLAITLFMGISQTCAWIIYNWVEVPGRKIFLKKAAQPALASA